MTAEKIVAQARENRPRGPPPNLATIDRGLRKLLRTMLSGIRLRRDRGGPPGRACSTLAVVLAEVEDLQRRHRDRRGVKKIYESAIFVG